MQPEEQNARKTSSQEQSVNLEKLLEERERLEELIRNKFTRKITVMFTDFKGSTSIAESEGDMFSRMLIKKHNDIVFPLLEKNRGVLVKTMGDGTLSYFDRAADAVSAAVQIQKEINAFNLSGKSNIPIILRIGMNTGTGIIEKHDIFGDVVNVASRFESLAGSGEIFISEMTYDALDDKDAYYCRHVQTTTLKGKKEFFKIFKVFWNEEDIARDKALGDYTVPEPTRSEPAFAAEKSEPVAARKAPDQEVVTEDSIISQKALRLRENNEQIELYLCCEEFLQLRGVSEIYHSLKQDLLKRGKIETYLNGKKALWFFKDSITLGRFPAADFPITNQAFARIPIRIGIRNGEGVLKIEGRGEGKIHVTEVQRGSRTETLKPDIEYALGREGKIIFAACFPFEYRFYKGRFLILNILNPEECIRKQFGFQLRDIWKEFDAESERFLVIGI